MSAGLDFVAVDVETANQNIGSICQIGLATVRAGKVENVWTQLINPGDSFASINISIHGIHKDMVKNSPKFDEIYDELKSRFSQVEVVVSHTLFDLRAISAACKYSQKPLLEKTWLDSAYIARRSWPEKYSRKGYNLAKIASDFGIPFSHHDAGEDARAAAEIVIRACTDTGLNINDW